jgi:hypothetical protein
MQTFQDLVQVLRHCLRFRIWMNTCAFLVSNISWTTQKANYMLILTRGKSFPKKICMRKKFAVDSMNL